MLIRIYRRFIPGTSPRISPERKADYPAATDASTHIPQTAPGRSRVDVLLLRAPGMGRFNRLGCQCGVELRRSLRDTFFLRRVFPKTSLPGKPQRPLPGQNPKAPTGPGTKPPTGVSQGLPPPGRGLLTSPSLPSIFPGQIFYLHMERGGSPPSSPSRSGRGGGMEKFCAWSLMML